MAKVVAGQRLHCRGILHPMCWTPGSARQLEHLMRLQLQAAAAGWVLQAAGLLPAPELGLHDLMVAQDAKCVLAVEPLVAMG